MFVRFRAVGIHGRRRFQFAVLVDGGQIADGFPAAASGLRARIIGGVAVDERRPLHRLRVQVLDAVQKHLACIISTNAKSYYHSAHG